MNTATIRQVVIITPSLKHRFESKSIKSDSGCHIWTGAVSRTGYGKFRLSDGPQDAHVVAWRIANNGISVPVNKLVMHSCDCRLCVNPQHLILGTSSQNMKQAHVDGRGDDFVSRGEARHNAVLTEAMVVTLRSEYATGGISGKKLAERHGVSYWAVREVLRGNTWKHVDIANLPAARGGK